MSAVASPPTEPSIIAHFSKVRAYAFAVGGLIACGLMDALILHHPAGIPLEEYLDSKGLYRFWFAIVGLAASGFLIVRMVLILRQLVLKGSAAIWVCEGRLFYIDTYWFGLILSLRIEEIRSVTAGTLNMGVSSVVITSNGGEASMPAWLLRETIETIAARINEIRQRANI